jgi:hypothetical protein
MAIQIQNKWQSIYKTNGNPYTKQVAIQLQSKWQSIYKTNDNTDTRQLTIQIKTNDNLEYVYTLYT